MLVLVAHLALADTVTLRFDPRGPAPAALRCVSDRARTLGDATTRQHLELRTEPTIEKQGKRWAMGNGKIEVTASSAEPPPPPGAPDLAKLLALADSIVPDTLVDRKGAWVGVEEVPASVQEVAVGAILDQAGLPPELAARLKPTLLQALGPEPTAARLRESWYTTLGHWLGRTVEIGRTETGEVGAGEPLAAGTRITWGATRRVACGGAGPADCVELRLEATPPAEDVTRQAGGMLAQVAQAMGVPLDQVRYEAVAITTTWTEVVDPSSMATWASSRARVSDVRMTVSGQPFAATVRDDFACRAE